MTVNQKEFEGGKGFTQESEASVIYNILNDESNLMAELPINVPKEMA